ncbi:unannotated protein [freshwater metagenome]|uniref:Unannotated protein n=1 Tax=freshwater metagenome TaxID=449393 RepID=A0A6J7NI12_9ZZZZ
MSKSPSPNEPNNIENIPSAPAQLAGSTPSGTGASGFVCSEINSAVSRLSPIATVELACSSMRGCTSASTRTGMGAGATGIPPNEGVWAPTSTSATSPSKSSARVETSPSAKTMTRTLPASSARRSNSAPVIVSASRTAMSPIPGKAIAVSSGSSLIPAPITKSTRSFSISCVTEAQTAERFDRGA